MYKYIHTCIHIHISCPHTYTHTHIYTHVYKMYIWTHAKHVWNDGAAATARVAKLDTKKLCPSPCPHHDSAPSRPHPLICTGAEPIHPIRFPRQLPAWPWSPETRSFFCHFGGVFLIIYGYIGGRNTTQWNGPNLSALDGAGGGGIGQGGTTSGSLNAVIVDLIQTILEKVVMEDISQQWMA